MLADTYALTPAAIRSDPVRQKQMGGGPIPHPFIGLDGNGHGVLFPSNCLIEESGTVSALLSGADTNLSSACSAERSPAEKLDSA